MIVSIHNHQLTIHHAKNTLLIVNHIPDYPDRVNALNYSDDETSMCLSKTRGHDSIGRLKWAPNVEVKPPHVAILLTYILAFTVGTLRLTLRAPRTAHRIQRVEVSDEVSFGTESCLNS